MLEQKRWIRTLSCFATYFLTGLAVWETLRIVSVVFGQQEPGAASDFELSNSHSELQWQ